MIEIRPLSAKETELCLSELSAVMVDCVEGGASMGYMSPFSMQEAFGFWRAVVDDIAKGWVLHLAAFEEATLVGTVQVVLKQPPNQPHRGDLKKLMVMTSARGKGIARKLMDAAEMAARSSGKTLLVLDTATESDAESVYPKLGWNRVGIIPNYAKFPDGRYCDTTVFYKEL
jgi:GNAT superfamily N-acetyltransferase